MRQIELIQVFENGEDISLEKFDDFSRQNGVTYWLASELALMLGYKSIDGLTKAINKAHSVCISTKIPIVDNFIQLPDGDIKMTRFACYLVVMNGDISNPKVATAQTYFAHLADEINALYQNSQDMERVYLRGDISEREKSLSHTAHKHGVDNYALFQNAGYRGMYNMNLSELKRKKGFNLPRGSMLDVMNSEELAANIFRVTQTEAKIRNQNILGQKQLENAAESVGKSVRNVMIENTGTRPEDLQLCNEKIEQIKSDIKKTHKALIKHDKK